MSSFKRVAVVGPGAVGSFFGGMLARTGARVGFIGRPGSNSPHLASIRERGLIFDGVEVQESVPIEVVDAERGLKRADLVLFAVKTLDTDSAARGMGRHLSADATVVSLQNGIDNVERLGKLGIEAIPAVVVVAAAIDTPGTVRHRGRGDLILGEGARARQVADLFRGAGVPCEVTERIWHELWSKLILNSMANATSALTHASYRRLMEFEPTRRISQASAREAIAVAAADGIDLDLEELLARGQAIIESVGEATSSTEQDIASGRRTEIDSLNGYIARRGAELGVATPIHELLWALVKLREERGRA